jgi:membrane-bound ClpP family serine protease
MTGLGMALLVIGALIAVAEAHYPTHGIAGGIGVVAMAIGAVLAISGLGAGLLLALLAGLTLAGIGVGIVTLSLKQGVAVRRRRIRTGAEAIDGALWRACRSVARDEDEDHELHAGDSVVVERLTGLTLSVRRAEEWELVL